MAITPQTDLFLVKCPLQLSNKHQLTFNSKDEQFNYFRSLPRLELDQISYIRKDNIIRFNQHIDSLLEYNYCFYQNENYSNKWFYAFIVRMEYVNDNCTNIYIKQDVWQTWQFDLVYLQSFVEREMINVADDISGKNLVPEGLEIGEPIIQSTFSNYDFEPAYVLAYSNNVLIEGETINQTGQTVNGIYSSIPYFVCNPGGFKDLMSAINSSGEEGAFSQYIVACFTVPILAVKSEYIPDIPTYILIDHDRKENPVTYNVANKPTNLNGYVPRNKKLLQYPFTYLAFNPSNSTSKIFRFEDFTSSNVQFEGMSEINPNPQVALIPLNYKGLIGENTQEVVYFGGYPNISSKVDNFNVWLASSSNLLQIQEKRENLNYSQTKAQQQVDVVSGILNSTLGAISTNAGGNIASGMTSLANTGINAISNERNHELNIQELTAQVEAQSLVPDNASLSGSNSTLLGYQKISQNIFATYSIKPEFARKIDKYFDMYGYQTNELKVPNIKNRPNWNYVKTVGCNINGNIPQMDLAEIKELFNSGITLWHSTVNFKNYSANNR